MSSLSFPNPHPAFRTDIQALRGFAVLVVLFYHAQLALFPAGFLGVDIFFVISGFLITSLIRNCIDAGSFRFAAFYFRRAKRLLPAAYVTFLGTALLAPFFLTSPEMDDFLRQMGGAVTFSANFVLRAQTGYFEGGSEFKPLLHVWSLAVEEQYYFVLPALMVFVPRRFWLGGAALLAVGSLALCLARPYDDSTFFLLPARAWELLIGSVGALLPPGRRVDAVAKVAFWPALIVMLIWPFLSPTRYHPGPDALLVCIATLVVILRRHPLLSRGIAMQALARVGDMSYSLYLVHWPLFAFFNNAWIGEAGTHPPLAPRLGLVLLSLVLAYLLNRFVEEPVRSMEIRRPRRMLLPTMAVSIGLVAATAGMAHAFDGERDYARAREPNRGFGRECNFETDFQPLEKCRSTASPGILVWGDSYAMHLVAGLRDTAGDAPGIVQATRAACGPFIDLAPIASAHSGGRNRRWAERCIRFNDSVLAYLKDASNIHTVVLSSPFERYVRPGDRLLRRSGPQGAFEPAEADVALAVRAMKATIEAIRAQGKKVVVVAPPPSGGFDVARCLERMERGMPTIGMRGQCEIGLQAYRIEQKEVLAFLAELPRQADVDVIPLADHLCLGTSCRTYADGTFLYRDAGHLSYGGSILIARGMGLSTKVLSAAR